MHIDKYNTYLEFLFACHKNPPYERLNEGKVYIGLPTVDEIVFDNHKDKQEFVYLLCMFVAIDLKTFEIYNDQYFNLKKAFYIPKFEYGLTNTFIYPNRIFDEFKIGINEECFKASFLTFYNFCSELTKNITPPISFITLLRSICADPDLKHGLFGSTFTKLIISKINVL